MKWINNLIHSLRKTTKDSTLPTKDYLLANEDYILAAARKKFCSYTTDPRFATNMRNWSQKRKSSRSPTGWGIVILKEEEVRARLDKGQCWMDYPVLNEDGTEIEGVTGLDFL